jgi:hypothetical protein
MTSTTLGSIIVLFICCVWPLIVHVSILWISRRDWSASGDLLQKLFSSLGKKEDDL